MIWSFIKIGLIFLSIYAFFYRNNQNGFPEAARELHHQHSFVLRFQINAERIRNLQGIAASRLIIQ
jgi:hypothetical protein